ncbi:hypothetical protein MAR_016289 [Mya arenaria]|uniref:Uncharacterized protein n=1 Tax=Mya arenaria TaxID=6604 RepID=A0ABY7FJE5_MYAAR|nr:hypothetical protein MAR_016289 [Mya arenaria]
MTPREQNKTRRAWRKSQRARTKRIKDMNAMMTPPTSPDENRFQQNSRREAAQRNGRRKKLRDRAKAYRRILKLTTELNKERRLKEKYKKRSQRLKVKNVTSKMKNETEKAVQFSNVIIKHIRDRYRREKSYKQRRQISMLICSYEVLKKYRLGKFATKALGMTTHQMKSRKIRRITSIAPKKKEVTEFFERDDNSRMKADKKATITQKGCKKQIRLLNDDIKHLHAKYISEKKKISYSLFCKLKPFWVIKPTFRDRQTCLCKIHDNLDMKLTTAINNNMYHSRSVNDLLKCLTCDGSLDKKECMYRECNGCKGRSIPLNENIDRGRQVVWRVWRNKRIEIPKKDEVGSQTVRTVTKTVKEKDQGTLDQLNDEIQAEAQRASRHVFNIRHQYQAISRLKENLKAEDVLIHIDFSENYNCKYHQEIQSIHFGASQTQVSLHTGVAYTREKTYSFTSFSDCLKHNPAAIWAHLEPIMTFLKEKSNVSVLHILSDGPTTQYRNKQNFYLFSTKLFELGFQRGTWNFLEASHGKGAADGIGAAVKQHADRAVNTRSVDITNAEDMIRALKMTNTSVELFEVKEEAVERIEKELPKQLKVVPNTMKIHQNNIYYVVFLYYEQVMVKERGEVLSRVLSCFCSRPNICSCYGNSKCSFIDAQIIDSQLPQCPSLMNTSAGDVDLVRGENHAKRDAKQVNESLLLPVDTVDESLIGQFCMVLYDGIPYPGKVLDVDESDLHVQVMHKIDISGPFYQIFAVLSTEPQPVTKRHMKIDDKLFDAIESNVE